MLIKTLKKIKFFFARRKQKLHKLKKLGVPSYISVSAKFTFHGNISIGSYSRVGDNCHLDGEGAVQIGEGSILAPSVVVLSSSHIYDQDMCLPYSQGDKKAPVVIGRGVWVGWGAIILPGVTVGDAAVVAAGSVVAKDVRSGEVVAGNPARPIAERSISTEEIKTMTLNKDYYLKLLWGDSVVRNGRVKKAMEIVE
ncbi:UNVERIFIED_CONTAM: hypothetical protein GTU68_021911 [Idotea baltica]|nr:hypothetical protein [Idotea baltica]